MMRHLPRLASLVPAVFLPACGVPDVADLRLDGLSPPHIANIGRHDSAPQPYLIRPVIVAELSTTRDLRDLANNHADSTNAYVVLCRGRTHITRREKDFDIVLTGPLQEEFGSASGSQPRLDWRAPIDGRYSYSVAIVLRQQGGVTGVGSRAERSYAELDLMRDPVDLCLLIDTSNFGPRWRSNTVVIPAAAIRAAIAGAPPP